jgi:hypothetical protein
MSASCGRFNVRNCASQPSMLSLYLVESGSLVIGQLHRSRTGIRILVMVARSCKLGYIYIARPASKSGRSWNRQARACVIRCVDDGDGYDTEPRL